MFTLHHTAPGNHIQSLAAGVHFSRGMVFADAGFGECIQVPWGTFAEVCRRFADPDWYEHYHAELAAKVELQ